LNVIAAYDCCIKECQAYRIWFSVRICVTEWSILTHIGVYVFMYVCKYFFKIYFKHAPLPM
jgi:hypothetical protein